MAKNKETDKPAFRGKESEHISLVVGKDESVVKMGSYNLRLDLLEGWDDLSDPQQRYLHEYAKQPNQKTATAMKLGYPISRINKWFGQESFSKSVEQINDLYTEVLRGIDFKESIYNHKVRGRVLKARKAEGYHDKKPSSEHKHLHLNSSFKEAMKLLNNDSKE